MNNYYDNFVDINDLNPSKLRELNVEFQTRFQKFVCKAFKVPKSTAWSIGESLFTRMLDRRLAYHTPVHILAIFDFAEMHKIELLNWEELALWFHDSVYEATADKGVSELCSADFMKACMSPYLTCDKNCLDRDLLNDVYAGIRMTENHLEGIIPPKFHKILDLDLAGFAMKPESYKKTAVLLRKENSHVSDEAFEIGRKKFLQKLLSKGFIYRSDMFRIQFENIALSNVQSDLEISSMQRI
jgi:predicted metal-dependent HD superfamily phosphohydrolase